MITESGRYNYFKCWAKKLFALYIPLWMGKVVNSLCSFFVGILVSSFARTKLPRRAYQQPRTVSRNEEKTCCSFDLSCVIFFLFPEYIYRDRRKHHVQVEETPHTSSEVVLWTRVHLNHTIHRYHCIVELSVCAYSTTMYFQRLSVQEASTQ